LEPSALPISFTLLITMANIKDVKNIGKATNVPAKKIFIKKPNFKSVPSGKKYIKTKDSTKPIKNHFGFSNRFAMISILAKSAIIKIDEKTTAFTNHVDPKRSEHVVTLFVSRRRKPAPKKKNKGFILFIFKGVKMNIDAREITISIIRVVK